MIGTPLAGRLFYEMQGEGLGELKGGCRCGHVRTHTGNTARGPEKDGYPRRRSPDRSFLHEEHRPRAGRAAREIMEGHERLAGLAVGSPFERAARRGAKIVMIGCNFAQLSLIHAAEELAQAPYLSVFPWWHRGWKPTAQIRQGRGTLRVHYPAVPGCSRSFGAAQEWLHRDERDMTRRCSCRAICERYRRAGSGNLRRIFPCRAAQREKAPVPALPVDLPPASYSRPNAHRTESSARQRRQHPGSDRQAGGKPYRRRHQPYPSTRSNSFRFVFHASSFVGRGGNFSTSLLAIASHAP